MCYYSFRWKLTSHRKPTENAKLPDLMHWTASSADTHLGSRSNTCDTWGVYVKYVFEPTRAAREFHIILDLSPILFTAETDITSVPRNNVTRENCQNSWKLISNNFSNDKRRGDGGRWVGGRWSAEDERTSGSNYERDPTL